MKKIATLLLAAGLVFGAATGASAIDFKAKGQWIMSFDYGQNGGFTGGASIGLPSIMAFAMMVARSSRGSARRFAVILEK